MRGLFEQRAVAFLDVLGFKQVVSEAEAAPSAPNKLVALHTVVNSHVKWDNSRLKPEVPEEAHPKYIFISDSIIISVPFKVLIDGVDGLDILVVKCTEVSQKILELGLLVRGGISIGNVWHDEANIFGSGYIDAYETEKTAKHPRIVLSGAASSHWRQDGKFAPNLCLPDNGVDIVDILYADYLRTNKDGIPREDYFRRVRNNINLALKNDDLRLGSDARSKWEWMAGFFNAALTRHGLSTEPFTSLPFSE